DAPLACRAPSAHRMSGRSPPAESTPGRIGDRTDGGERSPRAAITAVHWSVVAWLSSRHYAAPRASSRQIRRMIPLDRPSGRGSERRMQMERRDFIRHGSFAAGAALLGVHRFPHALYAAEKAKNAQDVVSLGRSGLRVTRLAQGTGTSGVAKS